MDKRKHQSPLTRLSERETSFTRLLGVYVHFAPPSLQLNVPFHTPVLPLISHCFFFIGIIPLDLAKSRGPLVLKLGVEHVAAAGGGDVVACWESLLVSTFVARGRSRR